MMPSMTLTGLALLGGQAGRPGRRADLDALAAARAGVDHRVDAGLQDGFEGLGHARSVPPTSRPIEGPSKSM